jgi:hypothetical protein
MTCGWEQGPPVGPGYTAPFRCSANIAKVTVDVIDGPPEPERDLAAEFEAVMSEQ